MRFALKRGPERLTATISGRIVPVTVKRSARARRLILRLDARTGLPVMTLPSRTSLTLGETFLRKNIGWLEARIDRSPGCAPFVDGLVFPLRGEPCRIVHRGGRGLVRFDSTEEGVVLSVPGDLAHLSRRLADWLKDQARTDLQTAAARHALALGRHVGAIRIGDARSRWGSCSSSGTLTFSWRLVLAPPAVLDYLAAHEVAHLAEMNHGPRFWATVRRLDPQYETARVWLKQHGAGLHAVGRGQDD